MNEEALDTFAGPWMEAFDQAMLKRDRMAFQDDAGHREANLYLTYATHRLGGKVDRAAEARQGDPAQAPPGRVRRPLAQDGKKSTG
jgi:hypothetical protein